MSDEGNPSLRLLGRILLVGGVGLVLAACAAIGLEQYRASRDKSNHPAPGKLWDLGGYRLDLDCQGQGPVVVFEAGSMGVALDWAKVAPEVAKFARACTYDRAGRGWSERSPKKRSAENIAAELHLLLERAGERGPYLLVGHSTGGLYARTFTQKYPAEVSGLVLVDSSQEDTLSATDLAQMLRSCRIGRALVPFGLLRAWGLFDHEAGLSPEDEKTQAALRYRHGFLATTCSETAALPESLATLARGDVSLGDKPLAVITAATTELPKGVPRNDFDARRRAWIESQQRLAALSTNSTHVRAEKSGHLVQLSEPEVVVAAIRWALSQAKP